MSDQLRVGAQAPDPRAGPRAGVDGIRGRAGATGDGLRRTADDAVEVATRKQEKPADGVGPWIGTTAAFAFLSGVLTKKWKLSVVSAGTGGLFVLGRTLARSETEPQTPWQICAIGGLKGALVGAQVGLVVLAAPGDKAATFRLMARAAGRGAAVGVPFGIGMGAAEALSGTFLI